MRWVCYSGPSGCGDAMSTAWGGVGGIGAAVGGPRAGGAGRLVAWRWLCWRGGVGQPAGAGSAWRPKAPASSVAQGPGGLLAQRCGAGVEGEAAGNMKESVAQALGLAASEFAVQEQSSGRGEQVVGDAHQVKPDAVVLEVADGQAARAGVPVAADVVLDPCTGARRRRSKSAMSPTWSVRTAWKRCPSRSVTLSCAPGGARS